MPSIDPDKLKELKDWLNIVGVLGAFLIAIVAFWNSLHISGLEDYFRSEISRRNAELADSGRARRSLDDQITAARLQLSGFNASLMESIRETEHQQGLYSDATRKLEEANTARVEAALEASRADEQRHHSEAQSQQGLLTANAALEKSKSEREQIIATSEAVGNRILPILLTTELVQLRPTLGDIYASPQYTLLYDRSDPKFADYAGDGASTFIFTTVDKYEIERSLEGGVNSSCAISSSEFLMGMQIRIDSDLDMTATALSIKSDLYRKVCASLKVEYQVGRSNGKGGLILSKANGLEVLRKGQEGGPYISLIPGSVFGTPYEQLAVKNFWAPAIGTFLMDRKSINAMSVEVERGIPDVFSSRPLALGSLQKLYRNLTITRGPNGTVTGAAALDKGIKDLSEEWDAYFPGVSVSVGGHMRYLSLGEKVAEVIPRIRASDIEALRILDLGIIFQEYTYGVNCAGARFALSHDYVVASQAGALQGCKQYQQSINSLSGEREYFRGLTRDTATPPQRH